MQLYLIILLINVIILKYIQSIDLFYVRKNGTACYLNRHSGCYFIYNNKKYPFPNRFTHLSYGYWEPHFCDGISSSLPDGDMIDSMWKSNTPNYHFLSKLKNPNQTSSFVIDVVERFRGFTNAAMLYRPKHNDWIIKVVGRKDPVPINGFRGEDRFRLLQIPNPNITALSDDLNESTYWMVELQGQMVNRNPSFHYIDMMGADCRLISNNNEIVYYNYAQHYHKSSAKFFYGQLYFYNKQLATEDIIDITFAISNHNEYNKQDQKNWVSFIYNNELLFIHYIWPFNVLRIEIDKVRSWIGYAYDYNQWLDKAPFDLPWKYGKPHGGTPAIRMNNGEYLGFFHSYRADYYPDQDVITTYAMGAYTFTNFTNNNKIIFKLTSISIEPIIIGDNMYKDRWLHDIRLFGYIDYAVFPTSLIIENDYVYLMYAYQNIYNYIAKINLNELLNSMEKISY